MSNTLTAELTTRLAFWRQEIDAALEACCQFRDACPEDLAEAIRYSLLAPGKRLRPLLALSAAESCGSEWKSALPAGCAVEMIHAYSLIHDDLPAMDDDDLRRGRPTCHVKFGEATAILAGDALIAMAFQSLTCGIPGITDSPPSNVAESCAVLAQAAGPEALVGGQAADLQAERTSSGLGLEELEAIHRRKTGALLRAAVTLGGLAADASREPIGHLQTYGLQIGLAFQIIDDLLDANGDEQALGKKVGRDAQLGKLTYPGLLGVQASRQRAEDLIVAACEELVQLPGDTATLEGIAQFIVSRDR